MNKFGFLMLTTALVTTPLTVMAQYTGGDVKDGGSISGTVKFKGTAPAPKKLDAKKVTLDQNGCEYKPHVLAFPAGSTVEILNPDGILHNVHSYSKVNSPFNQAQPKFKKTLEVKVDKPEAVEVKCDVHGWMQGWLVATANPYFAVTDGSGSFKLTDVPAGSYTVEVWHEKLGKSTQKVAVKAKEDAKVSFEVAGK